LIYLLIDLFIYSFTHSFTYSFIRYNNIRTFIRRTMSAELKIVI